MNTDTAGLGRLFAHHKVFVNGVLLHVVVGGQGPALVLLKTCASCCGRWGTSEPS